MSEYIARALGSAAVTTIGLAPAHIHAIRIGHANAQTALGQNMRDQAGGGGLAVHA